MDRLARSFRSRPLEPAKGLSQTFFEPYFWFVAKDVPRQADIRLGVKRISRAGGRVKRLELAAHRSRKSLQQGIQTLAFAAANVKYSTRRFFPGTCEQIRLDNVLHVDEIPR